MDSSTTDLVSFASVLVLLGQFVHVLCSLYAAQVKIATYCCLACEMLSTEYVIAENL